MHVIKADSSAHSHTEDLFLAWSSTEAGLSILPING